MLLISAPALLPTAPICTSCLGKHAALHLHLVNQMLYAMGRANCAPATRLFLLEQFATPPAMSTTHARAVLTRVPSALPLAMVRALVYLLHRLALATLDSLARHVHSKLSFRSLF